MEGTVKLIDRIDIQVCEDNQAAVSGLYYRFPEYMIDDYEQQLFGTTGGLMVSKRVVFPTMQMGPSRFLHTRGQQLLHGSGKFHECSDYVKTSVVARVQRVHGRNVIFYVKITRRKMSHSGSGNAISIKIRESFPLGRMPCSRC